MAEVIPETNSGRSALVWADLLHSLAFVFISYTRFMFFSHLSTDLQISSLHLNGYINLKWTAK